MHTRLSLAVTCAAVAALLLALPSAARGVAASGATAEQSVKVFLLAGQSNIRDGTAVQSPGR
jgi:hypothetical protein